MPMFDRQCDACEYVKLDCLEPFDSPKFACPNCNAGWMLRTWIQGNANSVIGDECDVWVRNGICHDDGSPRHYTHKSEMKRVAEEKGLINKVRHVGGKGSDKSKHTSRWV